MNESIAVAAGQFSHPRSGLETAVALVADDEFLFTGTVALRCGSAALRQPCPQRPSAESIARKRTHDRSDEMTDVTVTNRRADGSANEDLAKLARHGADTFGYKAHLRVDRQLAQLLRLRVSQINNCTYCLNLHYAAARDAGIPRPVIDTLTAWWETDFHDDAARAAIAYTEALTRVADATIADDFGARHDALAEHFSPEEILEIIGIVINMNVWTRLKVAEGAVPGLAEQAMS